MSISTRLLPPPISVLAWALSSSLRNAFINSLAVRVGLNAGEPIEEDGDVHGTAVNLAARVCAWADGNTLLLTAAVRHLAAGKGFQFLDRGAAKLKGFAEEVELYELLPLPTAG